MAEIRYGVLQPQPGTTIVTGIGSQPGPGGGDGWQQLAATYDGTFPAGTGRYVVICTGKIGRIQRTGATPTNGVLQVCLGLDSGLRSPLQMQQVSLLEQLGLFEAIPFQFMMMQSASPAIGDPFFGATFDASSGARFCLWARSYWNGDPTNYAASFEISDVSWLIFDTDRIPGADQLCEVYAPGPPLPLATTNSGIAVTVNQPGNAGEEWLHFVNVIYRPSGVAGNESAPSFRFGWSPTIGGFTGFETKVGTNGRWGQGRGRGNAVGVHLSQGAFWQLQQPSGTFLPALMGFDRVQPGGRATRLVRYSYFGLRLDNLLDVLIRNETEVPNATCNLLSPGPAFPSVYVPLERPATGVVSTPCVMAHGIVQTQGPQQSFEAALGTNQNPVLDFFESAAVSDAGRQEGVSCMSFSPQALSPSLPAIQLRAYFVGGFNAPQLSLPVRDFCLVQFNLVRDPEVLPTQPGTVGAPIVIVPGKESADAGSLQVLPIAPSREIAEDPAIESAAIEGVAYRRTWPIFTKVRSTFALHWEGLNGTTGPNLYAFLLANTAFAWAPPQRTARALVQLEEPELRQITGQGMTYSLSVRCAELIFTGS